jgi:hypothetical protein
MQITKKIRTAHTDIWIGDDGILRVKSDEGTEVTLEEATACFNAYLELGCKETKILQLIYVNGSLNITSEARDYAAVHGPQFFIASAIINNSLAIRLIVNFFNSFYKKQAPFKMFPNEETALKWLSSFR